MKNQRRIEFRKADKDGAFLMKGTHYLLLSISDKLSASEGLECEAL